MKLKGTGCSHINKLVISRTLGHMFRLTNTESIWLRGEREPGAFFLAADGTFNLRAVEEFAGIEVEGRESQTSFQIASASTISTTPPT